MADKIKGNDVILFSAGEASGDAVAAALLSEIRKLGYAHKAYAIGGPKLDLAGAELLADSRKWGAIGIYQSLLVAPRVWRAFRRVKAWIRAIRPSLLVAVDFGFVNVKLCRIAKAVGCKTLYFMPPGSWRRDKQGADLPTVSDWIATPFEWSAQLLREMGAKVEWVGHPILQMAAQFAEGDREGLAVLPGSRIHEVKNNLPAIASAIELIGAEANPVRIVASPTVSTEFIAQRWQSLSDVTIELSTEAAFATLKRARAAIVCSGTATLECAVCDCPMVVVYRGDKIMEIEYRLRKPRFEFVALPSILLRKRVVPELLQWDATPERIANEVTTLIADSKERHDQLKDFEEIRRVLGPADALTRTATLAMRLLSQSQ